LLELKVRSKLSQVEDFGAKESARLCIDDERHQFETVFPRAICADTKLIRAIVNDGFNWDRLLKLARQNRVRPLLMRSLKPGLRGPGVRGSDSAGLG
jgi:hypothetical protein